MLAEPMEEMYFDWLCAKVMPPHSDEYNGLLLVLHSTPFEWVIIGDDNRAADGLDLRSSFLRETHFYKERNWFDMQCSVLEMLIALGYRATQVGMSVSEWFWLFIRNLGLDEYRRITEDDVPDIQEILEAFIWRNYRENGDGGLFPLHSPKRDQTKVEIWYQFGDYVEDQQLV